MDRLGSPMSRRGLLAALAALLALGPIIAGVTITSGSVPARVTDGLSFVPTGPSATPPAPPTTGQRADALPPGRGALIAIVRRATTMRTAAGGPPLARLSARTEYGSPEVLWVVAHAGNWLGVVSPLAGNNRTGWIQQSAVTLTRTDWKLEVSLSQRRLTVLQGAAVRARYAVAVGTPDAPTPTGRFAVTDRLSTGDPSGPYGCCILALSAKAPHAIQGWSGGDRIAIHSTPETSSIGLSVSHGCLRLTLSEGRWLIAHVPLGTPTLIRT